MSDDVPESLGRYRIEREIGRGTMGVVYRAHDPALGRTVALKTVRLAFSIPEQERELFEKRFLVEARVAAGLGHPGIVVVHDVGRDAETGTLFIALEHLEGRSLSQMTEDGRPLEWRRALTLTAQLARALHHAHAGGIVHRDIKPANVMVLPTGETKIMDFGIAKVPASQLTSAGEFFGTPSYMSPEQAGGLAVDGRSDLFSLGAVLYLLLTGQRAFDAPNVPAILARVAHQDPPRPTRVLPGLPPDVDYLVARALAKDPGDRFPDGGAFAEDIEDVLAARSPRHRAGWEEPARFEATRVAARPAMERGTEPVTAEQPQAAPAAARAAWWQRLRTPGLLALGALAASGLVLALWLPRPRPAPLPTDAAGPSAEGAPAPAEGSERARPSFRLPFFREPARIEVSFEHSLRRGTLKIYVDDELVLEEPLESQVTRKIITFKKRKGSETGVLEVAPGERVVRIEVLEGDDVWSKRIRGTFESGQTRRLGARLGGLLTKELALWWGS